MTSEPLSRPCPVCDQGDREPFLVKAQLRLVRCRHCSMVYVSPVPPQFASGEYYNKTAGEYYLSPAKLESDYAPVRFQRELRLFRKYCRRGSILDVGCSTGAFLFQLNRCFPGAYQTLGTDASGPALDYAQSRGLAVLRGDFLKQDFGARRFDAVTFWAVLEHLSEPRLFLEKARALLNKGGLCFVLVPNFRSLASRLLGGRYRYIYPQHLNYFTLATLTRLIEPGFSILESRATHFNPVVIWQDWRGAGETVSNEQRGELLKRTTGWKQKSWLAPARAAYSAVEATLALLGLADNLVFVLRSRPVNVGGINCA